MKKYTLIAITLFYIAFTSAQVNVELKINPLGALFGSPDISAEYIVTDEFGVELAAEMHIGKYHVFSSEITDDIRKSGYGFMLAAKYYFYPYDACDGFYAGLYARQNSFRVFNRVDTNYYEFNREIIAGGFMLGRKYKGDSGFLLDTGFGVGRLFVEKNQWLNEYNGDDFDINIGFDLMWKLAIGYRF